jgi:2-oxoglutarate ferredoxin oxidoreductase subunit beta
LRSRLEQPLSHAVLPDAHNLSDMILEGLRWPGFAHVEVLSPCMAFRSEEFGWKENVHPARPTIENDRAAAFAALTADDGFSLGVLFRDNRDGRTARKTSPPTSLLSQIESQFHVAIRLAPQ